MLHGTAKQNKKQKCNQVGETKVVQRENKEKTQEVAKSGEPKRGTEMRRAVWRALGQGKPLGWGWGSGLTELA